MENVPKIKKVYKLKDKVMEELLIYFKKKHCLMISCNKKVCFC